MCIVLYTTSFLAELGGVYLVIKQFRAAVERWSTHVTTAQRHGAVQSDPRWLLDPMYARYGVVPGQINETAATVDSLVVVNHAEQGLTVVLLLAGIVLGFIGNLAGLIS